MVLVSDETVWALQGGRLKLRLSSRSSCRPGEGSKSWATLEWLVDRLAAHGVERGDPIVAFGGGVIGDLAGFAAAILKRGCPWRADPDDPARPGRFLGRRQDRDQHAAGKNLVGAFHQPALVLIDPICLDTLPLRELRAGYAEVVKYGLLGDADFFAWCEANGRAAASPAMPRRASMPSRPASPPRPRSSPRTSARPAGRRALLNLGHTFAHALEAETGFSDALLHGEAVALGLVLAFRFSAERGLCSAADADRVAAHLETAGLPTRLEIGTGASLTAHMATDKKARGGRVPFILARGIGQAFVDIVRGTGRGRRFPRPAAANGRCGDGLKWTISSCRTASSIARTCPCPTIAAAVGTPVYVYSTATMERHARVFRAAVADCGPGSPRSPSRSRPIPMPRCSPRSPPRGWAPTSSRSANIAAPWRPGSRREKIVFAGVGKTAPEMAEALAGGLCQFNVESVEEAEMLSAVATGLGKDAPVAFRVNPDVEAGTHAKISTGAAYNKFGVAIDTRARRLCPRPRAAGPQGAGRRRPYRQPAHRPRAARGRLPQARRADRRRCAPPGMRSAMPISAAGSASPMTATCPTPPVPEAYGAMVAADRRRTGTSA